jgi:hypothetical protein
MQAIAGAGSIYDRSGYPLDAERSHHCLKIINCFLIGTFQRAYYSQPDNSSRDILSNPGAANLRKSPTLVPIRWSNVMRKLLVMLTFAGAIIVISSGSWAEDAGMVSTPIVLPAPVGHVQPTTRDFSPNSNDNKIEQRRLSAFDAKERELDQLLDKKLNICRC